MKRLLITGLLGLTLINHVHAGSLTQYLPSAPTVKDFSKGAAISVLPLVARAALMVPYAHFKKQDDPLDQTSSFRFALPSTDIVSFANSGWEKEFKDYPNDLERNTTGLMAGNKTNLNDIENRRVYLNRFLAFISIAGFGVALAKLTGAITNPTMAKFTSQLMGSNAQTFGIIAGLGTTLGLCSSHLTSCIKNA